MMMRSFSMYNEFHMLLNKVTKLNHKKQYVD